MNPNPGSDSVWPPFSEGVDRFDPYLVELGMSEVEAVADVPPRRSEAAAHSEYVVLLEAAARQMAAADVILLGLGQLRPFCSSEGNFVYCFG